MSKTTVNIEDAKEKLELVSFEGMVSMANVIVILDAVKKHYEFKNDLLQNNRDSEQVTISKKEYDWLKKCEKDLGGISFSL